jgi:hypothetical protein
MKRFIFPSIAQNHAVNSNCRKTAVYASLAAVISLAIPLTAAYAQVTPDYTGTVSCVETVDLGEGIFESSEHVYEVELIGNVITDRWGPGNDVEVGGLASLERPNRTVDLNNSLKGVTEIFWTMPANIYCIGFDFPLPTDFPENWNEFSTFDFCLPFETLYSETGRWKIKVQKGQFNFSGTSYAVMEYKFAAESSWIEMSAECTWDLSEVQDSP